MKPSDRGRLDCAGVIHKKEIRSCRREIQVLTNSSLFKISTSRFDKYSVNNFTRGKERQKRCQKEKEKKHKYENKKSLKDIFIC